MNILYVSVHMLLWYFVYVCMRVCVGCYCMFSGGLAEQECGCQKWIGWEVGT